MSLVFSVELPIIISLQSVELLRDLTLHFTLMPKQCNLPGYQCMLHRHSTRLRGQKSLELKDAMYYGHVASCVHWCSGHSVPASIVNISDFLVPWNKLTFHDSRIVIMFAYSLSNTPGTPSFPAQSHILCMICYSLFHTLECAEL